MKHLNIYLDNEDYNKLVKAKDNDRKTRHLKKLTWQEWILSKVED